MQSSITKGVRQGADTRGEMDGRTGSLSPLRSKKDFCALEGVRIQSSTSKVWGRVPLPEEISDGQGGLSP